MSYSFNNESVDNFDDWKDDNHDYLNEIYYNDGFHYEHIDLDNFHLDMYNKQKLAIETFIKHIGLNFMQFG